MSLDEILARPFGTLPDLIRLHAAQRRDGIEPGESVAIGKVLRRELREGYAGKPR
jgi:hypothetical protein